MTDEQIHELWRISNKHTWSAQDELREAYRLGQEQERRRCAQICHEKYMEYAHGKNHADPLDDYEYTLQSEIAKELRDEIVAHPTPGLVTDAIDK